MNKFTVTFSSLQHNALLLMLLKWRQKKTQMAKFLVNHWIKKEAFIIICDIVILNYYWYLWIYIYIRKLQKLMEQQLAFASSELINPGLKPLIKIEYSNNFLLYKKSKTSGKILIYIKYIIDVFFSFKLIFPFSMLQNYT